METVFDFCLVTEADGKVNKVEKQRLAAVDEPNDLGAYFLHS
jgi:hypothetical protein